jgi:hypothetical protein
VMTPTACVRAAGLLAEEALTGYEPLAVAAALLHPAEFRQFARRTLLDLQMPLQPACPAADSDAEQVERIFRLRFMAKIKAHINSLGIEPGQLTSPPSGLDPECRSYCTRCQTGYLVAQGACHSCGGIPLQTVPSPTALLAPSANSPKCTG